jgi:hypothetical protein
MPHVRLRHKDGWHFKHVRAKTEPSPAARTRTPSSCTVHRSPGQRISTNTASLAGQFLDTPDQALLVTVLFTDVLPGAGGTFIAADSAKHVARWFSQHPEGSHGLPGNETKRIIAACEDFVELTGKAGDMVLMHPFTLHTVSTNPTDRPRLITNPAPTLKEPMRFDRAVFEEHSIVEQYVLNALGKRSFAFQPTTERESNFVPGGFKGDGEVALGRLLDNLGVTFAAAGSDLRNTLPPTAEEQSKL